MGAVGYGISAALSIAAAMKAKDAYALQAKQAQDQADIAGIQADQEAINRTAQLNAQLASISATQSAGGVAVGTSASFKNIGRRETKVANADISAVTITAAVFAPFNPAVSVTKPNLETIDCIDCKVSPIFPSPVPFRPTTIPYPTN